MPESHDAIGGRSAWRADILAIVVLLLVVLVPRVAALGADPPTGGDLGGAFWDEGVWARNARQHVVFGRWIIDEVNPAMFVAPLYTVALAGVYQIAGVGLAQTRLLSGIAGFLTCLIVYGVLRTRGSVRYSLPAALVLGTTYFVVTNDRVGFTESFQLFLITATFAAAVLSVDRPWWAAASGVCFALSLLAKPSAAVMGLVMAGFWLAHWDLTRRRAFQPAFSLRQPVLFCAAGSVVLLAVLLLLVFPHWEAVRQQLTISLKEAFEEASHPAEDRVSFFGWGGLGMSMNGFFREMVIFLAAALVFLVSRVTRMVKRPADIVELLCWSWLVIGLLFLARQSYQPDRRFLFLAPAVAILACLGVQEGGMVLPGGKALTALVWWRRVLVGGLVGGFIGFYIQPYLSGPLSALAAGLPVGDGISLPPREARTLIWSASAAVGVGVILAGARLLPLESRKVPAVLLAIAFLVFNPGRFVLYASHLSYTVRDASRDLARMTAQWDESDRVMVGGAADTFGLETQLFTFAVRIRKNTGAALNTDGWERYRPSLAIISMPADEVPTRRSLQIAQAHGLIPVREYPIILEPDGTPRWKAILLMRPDLCRAGCTPLP